MKIFNVRIYHTNLQGIFSLVNKHENKGSDSKKSIIYLKLRSTTVIEIHYAGS